MIVKPLLLGLITLANLTSISIHSTWGGLGRPSVTDATIIRNNGALMRGDGSAVSPGDVQAFLDALQRTPADTFDVSRTGFKPVDLIDHLAVVESYLGDEAAIPQARAAFESAYLNFASFERGLSDKSWPCVTGRILDSYPHLAVQVEGGGEDITINSDSSNLYMLPLQLTFGSTTIPNCDPGLSRAIAQLLPKDATNRSRLDDNANAILNFGYGIANSDQENDIVARYGAPIPQIEHLARSMGLGLHYQLLPRSAKWTGEVWLADMPQVHMYLPDRSSLAIMYSRLLDRKRLLERVFRHAWFRKAIAEHPDAHVEIDTAADGAGVGDDLFNAGQIAAAAALARGATAPPMLNVWDSRGLWMRWWLLDNDDMLLEMFEPSHPPFAFSKAWYARIPHAPSIDSPGYMISGVVVHPNGQSQILAYPAGVSHSTAFAGGNARPKSRRDAGRNRTR